MARVIHFELPVEEPQRAIDFYSSVLGWEIMKWDGPMEYWLVKTGAEDEPGIDGGLFRRADEPWSEQLTIGVDSLDELSALWEERGGKIVTAKSAIPGVGWVAYGKDTEGNRFGLMESDPQAS